MDPSAKRPVRWSTAWREARTLIRAHRGRLALGLLLIAINAPAALVAPWASHFLIDKVVHAHRPDLLYVLAAVLGTAVVVQAVTSFALARTLSIAAQRAVADMRLRVQEHMMRLPVSFFDSSRTGQLISRIMTDAEGVRNLVGTGLVQLVGGTITASLALGVLIYLNWRMTLAIVVVLAIFGGVMALAFTRLRPLFRRRGEINADVTGRLGETLGAVRVVKAYVAEERETEVFGGGVERLFQNVRQSITGVSAVTAMTTLCIGVSGVILILMGGHAMLLWELAGDKKHGMTTGEFVEYVLFIGFVAAPMVQIAAIGTQLSEAFAGLDRIREVMSLPTEEDLHGGKGTLAELRGDVDFDHVAFAYVPDHDVLSGITFHTAAGTTTALVGSSGSGKSTLVSLIMGFQEPRAGTIRIDGRDLRTLSLGTLRRHLGVVFQDNVLFDGTVRENIAFARPDATPAEIEEAGRIAGCAEFVEGFTQRWETVVGERGVKLSGGQRQRIAIARAILADPRILVLDEATSSLDSESEAIVQQGLARLRHGRTTFVIAHRLSTIRAADQILVLEHGRIVERGTHEQLYAAGGRYRELHDRQHRLQQDQYLNPGEEPRLPPSPTAAPGAASPDAAAPRAR